MDNGPERRVAETAERHPADVLAELVTGVCARRPDLDELYMDLAMFGRVIAAAPER